MARHLMAAVLKGKAQISNVTIGTDGTLYGTTSVGGNSSCYPEGDGCGVVWMIKP